MKILILNWRDIKHPLAGGAERVTFTYAKAWVEQGWDVTWLAGNFKNNPSEEIISGIKMVRYGNVYTIYLLAPLIYWFRFWGKFDLIIDEIHGIPFFSPLWAFRSKKIAFIHEVSQNIWDVMYPFPINAIGKIIEKFSFTFYQHVPFMTVSNSTKKDLVKFGILSKHITIFSNGIMVDSARKFIQKEKKLTLLFVARLVKMKGIEDALSIFSSLEKQYPNSQLWIVGTGNPHYIKQLEQIVLEQKVKQKVKFFGFIDEEKKNTLYQRAHFLIHTSIREGFGLVVLEANIQGTPAIVYDSPGLRDVVENASNGYRIEIGNREAMVKKIVDVYNNKISYSTLTKKSREYAKRFDWKNITKDVVAFINKSL